MRLSTKNFLPPVLSAVFLMACQTGVAQEAETSEPPPPMAGGSSIADAKPGGGASIDRSQRPPAAPVPEVSFPEYETVTLENGLTLYLVESDRQPTVTYRMLIRSGGLYDGEKTGLSQMLADMLDKGVEGMSGYELANEIDFIGGSVGASSTSDFTTVSASGLSRYKETLLETLAALIMEPTFPQAELDKLKQRYASNLASQRQDPGEMADLLRRKLVYGDGGYGAIMTEETIAAIAREDLMVYREKHFIPNNASLAIVGDFEAENIVQLVKQVFRDWERGELPEPVDVEVPELEGVSIHIVDRPDSVQSAIRVAQQSIERSNPDALPLRLLMSIIGGGGHGRMYKNLREDKGFTYGAFSYAANAAKSGAIVTQLEVRNEVTAAAVAEVLKELERIRAEPVQEDEMELARKYMVGGYTLSLESSHETASRVQEIDVYGLDDDFYRDYLQNLAALTPESLSQLADERIATDLAVAIVGNADVIAEELGKFGPVTIYNDRLEIVEKP